MANEYKIFKKFVEITKYKLLNMTSLEIIENRMSSRPDPSKYRIPSWEYERMGNRQNWRCANCGRSEFQLKPLLRRHRIIALICRNCVNHPDKINIIGGTI